MIISSPGLGCGAARRRRAGRLTRVFSHNGSPHPILSRGEREQRVDRQGIGFPMVNRNLLRQYDLSEDELQTELASAFNIPEYDENHFWLPAEEKEFDVNKIVEGRVLNIVGDEVWIDVGYKSEGVIPLEEWKDDGMDKPALPKVGDTVQVLLEAVEDESGAIVLSYRKAKRQKEWEDIISKHKEGDVVSGGVTRKIK